MSTRLPALGLEDTAARILAACAAREPLQVDPWEASLPPALRAEPWAIDRCASALADVASAMARRLDSNQLYYVRGAAAEVRAWRLSLPEDQQKAPVVLRARYSVRSVLLWAIRALIDADTSGGAVRGHYLRHVEAYLRAAGEALIAQGAE